MERHTGLEALKNYPFKDVVVKQDQALTILTQRTMAAVSDNTTDLMGDFDPNNLKDTHFIDNLKKVHDTPEQFFSPGGLSISAGELDFIYQEWGNLTFSSVLQEFMNRVLPRFFQEKHSIRNPGTICVGYLLDIFKIMDPKVAGFDDGVQSAIVIMRSGKSNPNSISPFLLGAMIDDSIHLRGIDDHSPDVLVDKKASLELKDTFLRFANDEEKRDFNRGFNITINELSINAIGFSTS